MDPTIVLAYIPIKHSILAPTAVGQELVNFGQFEDKESLNLYNQAILSVSGDHNISSNQISELIQQSEVSTESPKPYSTPLLKLVPLVIFDSGSQ